MAEDARSEQEQNGAVAEMEQPAKSQTGAVVRAARRALFFLVLHLTDTLAATLLSHLRRNATQCKESETAAPIGVIPRPPVAPGARPQSRRAAPPHPANSCRSPPSSPVACPRCATAPPAA